jgi:hypothetical protein
MKPENKNEQVAEKIIEILRSGLTFSADTQHYIDSTFSNPSAVELEELLQDDSSCETDSLLELLFFPDESVQVQLEPLLDRTRFQKQDERKIQDMVLAKPLQAHFRFSDGRGALHMAAAPSSMAQFIARLNLTRLLNPKLRSAVARHVDKSLQDRCKVRLRNAAPITSPDKISFLKVCWEKLPIEKDIFFVYLDFLLYLLEELNDKPDMFPALMSKKKFYFQNLQKARNLDIQLKKHNVETLLLSGKRVSYIDAADARKKIQMIDRISIAIYGKTEFFDLMPTGERSIFLAGKAEIGKLMKEFS